MVTPLTVVAGIGAAGYADTLTRTPADLAARASDGRPSAVSGEPRDHGVLPHRTAPHPVARPGVVLRTRSLGRGAGHAHPATRRSGPPVVQRPHQHPRVVQGPLAANTARETVADAEDSTSNDPGHCLEWAREQAGIPSGATTAATAWDTAEMKRRGNATPPPGAAVYWMGGSQGFGHVAISVGHGRVRSSDAGGLGQVATVPVGWISRNWDLRYAGWSNSINGYTIPGVAAA